MKNDQPAPNAARQMLARYGTQIEYTDTEPGGLVNLAESEVGNDDLGDLVFFPGFAALDLDSTLISDAGMRFIGEMNGLEDVSLYDTLISDDGLKHIQGLPKLERLRISCAPGCFPSGLRPVSAAKVRRNQITNLGLDCLADMLTLRELDLQATQVTDAGLTRYLPRDGLNCRSCRLRISTSPIAVSTPYVTCNGWNV